MTPEEKAEELYQKFYNNYGYYGMPADAIIHAKQCALIAVDEILEATKHEYQIRFESGEWSREIGYKYSEYWQEVKQEIEKL